MDVRISPSLMCCDLMRIGDEIRTLEAIADEYHFDILDWHYCKNLSLAPCFTKGARLITEKPLEAHLYVDNVDDDLVELCLACGATTVTVDPLIAGENVRRFAQMCHDRGQRFGLFLNPAVQLEEALPYLEVTDRLLTLTVEPGFPGQEFQRPVLEKIEKAARLRDSLGLPYDIESDGCCNERWYRALRDAGTDTFVIGGSGLFNKAPTTAEAVEICKRELELALSS